jgi:hypothetical protein
MELLNKIQKELKAPKSQVNSFGNYKYRNCEDILEAVKPLLGEGTVTLSDEIVQVGERYYVKATAAFWNGEDGPKSRTWRNVSTTLIQPDLAFRLDSVTAANGLCAKRSGRHEGVCAKRRTAVESGGSANW